MTIQIRETDVDQVRYDVTVAMPCLNEEATIERCIARARQGIEAAGLFGEVLVVDNGSTDRSVERARKAGARVVHEPRRGYGFACRTCVTEARGDLVLLGDADGTYDFAELPRFVRLAWEGADVVMGSRRRGQIMQHAMPWHHRWIGVPALTWFLNAVGRAGVSDAHCGLRLIRRTSVGRLGLRSGGMEFASEMILEARRQKLRFAETPIVLAPREGGAPKLRSMRDGLRHTFLIASYLPGSLFGAVAAALVLTGAAFPRTSGLAMGALVCGVASRAVPSALLAHDGAARTRWAAVARAHWPIVAAVSAGVVVRAAAMVAYRPAMYFYGDSYTYQQLAEGLRVHTVRPPVYPFFLRILSFGGDAVVVIAQHAIGVGAAIAVYLLLRRLGAGPVGGALGAAPLLLDGYQIHIEQVVLSEALFQGLLVAAIVLLMWGDRAPSARLCALAGVLLGMATLTRSVGLVLVLPVIGYLIARRVGPRRIAALAVAFAVPLCAYATWFKVERGQFRLQNFEGRFLYGRVGEFADCSLFELPRRTRHLCDPRPAPARPGTNYYVWNDRSPIETFVPPAGLDRNAAARDFAWRAIRAQPADYLRAVAGDLAHYFAAGRWTDPRDHPVTAWKFQRSTQDVTFAMTLGQRTDVVTKPTAVQAGVAGALAAYQRVVYTPGPLVAAALLLALLGGAGLVGARRTLRPEALTFGAIAIMLLVLPTMTTIFDYRYLLGALPVITPGAVLGGRVVAERVRGRSRQPRHAHLSPAPAPAPEFT